MPTTARADLGLAGALRDAVGRLSRRMRAERLSTDMSLGQLAALRTLEGVVAAHPGNPEAHGHHAQLLSLAGNLLLMFVFVGGMKLNAIIANLITITICSLINFTLADRFVFV